ncbi:MAG: molybdate ABC transporter substrate-binding protein [Nocardioides sp.]
MPGSAFAPLPAQTSIRAAARARLASVLVAALAVTACSSAGSGQRASQARLVVFAASSLTATFESMGERFEADNPDTEVVFNFGGSADLASQILAGAPGDVVATADTAQMASLTQAGLLAGAPIPFASNTLEIAVPPDNPGGIDELTDLARDDVTLVVCAPQVPCGSAAVKIADAAEVALRPASEEASVTDVLGKVISGEADAGLVYVTDVIASDTKVMGIPIPEAQSAANTYPIATLETTTDEALAGEFVDFVLSPDGRGELTAAGFGQP